MKVSLLSIVLLGFTLASFSQTPVLSGTLRDAENKQPLSGATVKMVRGKDSVTVVSDKAGTFEFNNLVDTGVCEKDARVKPSKTIDKRLTFIVKF